MHGHGQPSVSAVCGNYNQPTPRPRPSKQTAMGAGAFAARPLPLARYTGAAGDGHRARRTHPARICMARDPHQARAAANSGRTQIDVHVRMLMPVPGPQAERNPVWDVAPGPAIRASGPWPPRSRPAPPRLPPSRSEPPRPRAPAPCSPRYHAVWGPGAAAGPPWRCPWRAPGARAPCVHRYPPISAPHRSPPRLVYAYSRACSRSAPQRAALGSSKYS